MKNNNFVFTTRWYVKQCSKQSIGFESFFFLTHICATVPNNNVTANHNVRCCKKFTTRIENSLHASFCYSRKCVEYFPLLTRLTIAQKPNLAKKKIHNFTLSFGNKHREIIFYITIYFFFFYFSNIRGKLPSKRNHTNELGIQDSFYFFTRFSDIIYHYKIWAANQKPPEVLPSLPL